MPVVQDAPFFGESISNNLVKTPEGLLVCRNVPVARIGTQKYLGNEIGLNDRYNQEVTVHRLPEDVFHADTIASFEGKPVTDDHPMQYPVTPDNYSSYAKGHVQNARKEGDYIVADLVINDPLLISKIEMKNKRQVSAGYDCDWIPYKDGLKQTNIRANHVAVVDQGRAGSKVAIKDSISKRSTRKMNKKQALAKMFAAFAKDASAEEIEEMLPYLESVPARDENAFAKLLKRFAKDDDIEEPPKKEASMDERITGIESGMQAICDRLDAMHKAKDAEGEEPDEDEDRELIEEMLGEDEEPDEFKKKDDEDCEDEVPEELKEEERKEAKDAAVRAVVLSLKPLIAKMPPRQQKAVKDALARQLGRGNTATYAEILKATKSHSKDAAAPAKDYAKLGSAIAKAYNPHYAEAKKIEI